MSRSFPVCFVIPTLCFSLAILSMGPLFLWLPCLWAAGPITPSGLNTQVSDPIAVGGQAQYDITGGTRPGGASGTNLFHSFGKFGVPPDNIANFLNGVSFDLDGNQLAAGLPTSNILGRVTGGNSSTIFGTIQTTGFGNANLFLMNPTGFLFGPNATVNVGGVMTFTTADYLKLADANNRLFNAVPDVAADALLSTWPVAAFGFIGSNPQAIDFEGGRLTIASGTGITLVGGNINLIRNLSDAPSSITAPGRQIRLTSVAGDGLVAADTGVPAPGMTLGNITLDQSTVLSTAGDLALQDGSGGSVSIRGGQLVATGATINTTPAALSTGSGGDVIVSFTNSATLTDSIIQTNDGLQADGSLLFAGPAGAVSIRANGSLSLTNTTIDASTISAAGNSGMVTLATNGPLSLTDSQILTFSFDSGNGGAVTTTGNDVTFNRAVISTFVDASGLDVTGTPALGEVRSGAVNVTAEDTVTLSGSDINESIIDARASATLLDASPIRITGKTVNLSNGTIVASMSNSGIVSPANGGTIEVRGNNVNLTQFQLLSVADGTLESTGTGGNILLRGAESLQANNIQLTASKVSALATTSGGGGNIEFQSKLLTVNDHTEVLTGSFGQGSGGTITVRGAEKVMIESGSRVSTDVVIGLPGVPQGTAGDIFFETQNLAVRSGGLISAGALPNSSGNAGNITVQGNGPTQSILIDGTGSGIVTNTEGTGTGGNITLNANIVTLQNSGTLSAKTSGTEATATGGSITVKATDQVTMTSGASITASSTGPGDAGNISINAGQTFLATNSNSAVTTQADAASGGNITLLATDRVQLTNSRIIASVADGSGGGGNISIDPQYVILQNSQILAQAADGQGGAITITTNLFLPDATSLVNADSGRPGLNGTVTIQSPNSPASGKIQPLGNQPLEATSLLNQRCAALAGGEFSSFTVAGRDSLPAEPGSWLASPLATLSAGTGRVGKAEGVKAEGGMPVARGEGREGDIQILSLRQVAPAGFLTQAFAVDWSAGCQS